MWVRCRERGKGGGRCINGPPPRQPTFARAGPSSALCPSNERKNRDFGGPSQTQGQYQRRPPGVQRAEGDRRPDLTGMRQPFTCSGDRQYQAPQRSPSRCPWPRRSRVFAGRDLSPQPEHAAPRYSAAKGSLSQDILERSVCGAPHYQELSLSQHHQPCTSRTFTRHEEQRHDEPDTQLPWLGNRSLVKDALHDPNSLTSEEVTALVQAVYRQAAMKAEYAKPAANFCVHLITKDRRNVYFNTILDVCRFWFAERQRLLPRWPPATSGQAEQQTWTPQYHWTAYVAFIASLVAAMNRKARNSAAPTVPAWYASHFAEIVCECCSIMVQSAAHDVATEMLCLRYVLSSAGSIVARSSPWCMAVLAQCIRKALQNPELGEYAHRIFRDIPELRALGGEYMVL